MTTKGRLEGDVRKTGAAAAETLRGRCADLGLPSWRFDQSLRLWSGPCETGKRAAWLASGPVTEAVGAAVAAAVERSDAEVVELGEGCWLIVLAERYSRRRTGSIAVMALGAAARTGGLIASGAAAAGADAETVWADLAELAVYDAADIPRLRRALMWMRDDLCQQYRDRVGLEEFGNQLTEMYEEIGLLYRLGRSMNRLTEPVQFVTTLCDDLVQTLPFQWVAARFADSARVAPALAGHLALAGSAVGRAEVVGGFAAGLIGGLDPSKWTLLREEDHPELAGLTGTGVLAHPISREREVVGVLLAGNKRGPDPEVSSFETQLLDAAADYLSVFTENAGLYADQHAVFVGTIRALTASIDAKDRYTRGHSERVAHLARQLARAAGLDEAAAEKIHISGLLHDVGKIGVPEAVLTKPGRLTDEEFDQIKLHPRIGHGILRDIPMLEFVLPGVLHHHERWDGNGYPDRISGDRVPLIARVLAVADSFDAMSSNRSYRSALPRAKVLAEIARCGGTQFDPELAKLFVALDLSEYDELVRRHESMAQGEGRAALRAA